MKISAAAADSFVRTPSASCVLVYGPDAGLVAERARALRHGVLGADGSDPFRYAELTAAAAASDPASLVDEAAAIAFGGGRRVVRLPAAADGHADAFAALLRARENREPAMESLVVAEAGELGARSPLRRVFEDSKAGAAVPCYPEEGRAAAAFAARTLGELGHEVDPAAAEWIARSVGGDRAVLRGELGKLSLFAGSGARVTAAAAEACLGDSATVGLDDAALAAARGDLAALDRALGRCFLAGQTPVGVLRGLSRTLQRVHLAAGLVADGKPAGAALKSLRPPVFWKQEESYVAALRLWSARGLACAIELLAEAELACKQAQTPDQAVAWRAALQVATAARRRA